MVGKFLVFVRLPNADIWAIFQFRLQLLNRRDQTSTHRVVQLWTFVRLLLDSNKDQ